jgi:hypothetical protein
MAPGPEEQALDRRIDPVARPREYQDLMLGLVGERDPATLQSELIDQTRSVVAAAGPHLRTRPAPNEWSVLELLGHLVDGEVVGAARYRWILAQDEPELIGYDQDRWVERMDHQNADPEDLLALLAALRRSNLDLWARSSDAERARAGIHVERGRESFDLLFRLMAGHGMFHLAQMRRTLRQVASHAGRGASPPPAD